MPLSINVGLSRKASKDYQSTGCSINVTAELDQSLLAKPDELQRQIDELYRQAEEAIDRRAHAPSPAQDGPERRVAASGHEARRNGNGRYARTGSGNGNAARQQPGSNGGMMTESQRRAILAIAKRVNTDPDAEARDIVGGSLDSLDIRQASDLIDHLRSLQPANGNSR